MRDLNRVQRIGHLGNDPEVTYTAPGTARTTFTVATSARWTDADGQVQETTTWSRCVAWGKLAELCGQLLHKGTRVYVEGRLRTHRWEDVDTGEVRAALEILIHDLIVFDQRSNPLRSAPTDARDPPFSP